MITDFYFNSNYEIDKVLQIFEGSFSAPSNQGGIPVTAQVVNTVGVNDFVYYAGIFNVDGGTYNDLGSEVTVNGVNIQCLGGSTKGSLSLYSNNGDSINHTIGYKIAAIAKPSNTLFTSSSIPNNKLYFSTAINYQKIALEGDKSVTVSLATSSPVDTVVSIPHNLGYHPCVRAFIDNGTTLTDLLVRNGVALIYNNNTLMTNSIDNSNVNFRFTNENGAAATYTIHYRIYYESN